MAGLMRAHIWPLSPALRLKMLLRSFCLQASWNFEGLQNLGFLFVILPGLKRLHKGEDLAAACSRHLEYFNSHPYLAPCVMGATLHIEATIACGHVDVENVTDFKKMVMAPYAAMGDAFFWGGIRPLAAVVALFFAYRGSLWAVAVFLLMFNIPHLVFRIMGFKRGLSLGLGIIHVIQAHRLPDLAMRAKETTVVLFGGLAAVLALDLLTARHVGGYFGFAVLPMVLVAVWVLRRLLAPIVMIYVAVATLVLLGAFMQ